MANFTKIAKAAGLGLALTLAGQAQASFINVGGVVWDPDSIQAGLTSEDFFLSATVFENATDGQLGTVVSGFGLVERINAGTSGVYDFCPGCELTYSFSMVTGNIVDLVTVGGITTSTFEFTDLVVTMYVDYTPDYAVTHATATDYDQIFLELEVNGALSGSGTQIGTGDDAGLGTALLDVVGGIAASNFDTNTQGNGADFIFSSSFNTSGTPGFLEGDVQLRGNSIPEPGSLALLGLGLLGLGGSVLKRRKA